MGVKKMKDVKTPKRQSVRFSPDPGAYAQIDVEGNCHDEDFDPSIVALITDEAYRGCGLVMLETDQLNIGDKCSIKVGRIGPILAEVKWKKEIDTSIVKIGFQFLE